MDGLAGVKSEAVTVLSKSWTTGKKNPPHLEAELSNGNLLRVGIDDVLELTTLRLFRGSADVLGEDVFQWWTGLPAETVDALLDEVRESNLGWWAEQAS